MIRALLNRIVPDDYARRERTRDYWLRRGWLVEFWGIEDVQNVAPGLAEAQCRQVLADMDKYHDAEIGVNWDSLRCQVDITVPDYEPPDDEEDRT